MADEMYIKYDMKKITLYDLNLNQGYSALSALLNEGVIGTYRNKDST